MSVMYEVTAYDRNTGRLVTFYDVPKRRIASVKNIAGIPPSDDGLGSYLIDRGQIAALASVLDTPIAEGDLDFFLEAYDGGTNRSAAG